MVKINENKRRILFFTVITICILIIGIILWIRSIEPDYQILKIGKNKWYEKQRELANKLESVGLYEQAAIEYEKYLENTKVPLKVRSNIAYSIGKIYMDLGKYEKAISWLYQVEIADPESKLKNETALKIVHCLEKLGKYNSAQYTLENKTDVTHKKAPPTEKIIAKIGNDEYTLKEINETLDKLPKEFQKEFKNKDKKLEFVKKYIADELLFRKAKKLEFDKDPDIRRKIEEFSKNLMVQKVMDTEIQQKVKIDESDIKLYFKANKNKYKDKKYEEIKEQVKQDYTIEKFSQEYNKLINQILLTSEVKLFPEVLE